MEAETKKTISMVIAAAVNKAKNETKDTFSVDELTLKLKTRSCPYYTEVVELLIEKSIVAKSIGSEGLFKFAIQNPIHHSFFIEVFEKEKKEHREDIGRFMKLLLDIQFYQRKEQAYSLEKLLKEYSIYTFPKKDIPDLTQITITNDVAGNMYKQLVLNYRKSLKKESVKVGSIDDVLVNIDSLKQDFQDIKNTLLLFVQNQNAIQANQKKLAAQKGIKL